MGAVHVWSFEEILFSNSVKKKKKVSKTAAKHLGPAGESPKSIKDLTDIHRFQSSLNSLHDYYKTKHSVRNGGLSCRSNFQPSLACRYVLLMSSVKGRTLYGTSQVDMIGDDFLG